MQQQLIIFLHKHDMVHPSWVILDAETNNMQYVQQGSAQELSQLASDKKVKVLVPTEDVLLTCAKLPKMNKARLAQTLPFALEEQLIGEVDTLHFVPSDYQTDDTLAVAIVSKEKMQEWLSWLTSCNVQADMLLPPLLMVATQDNTWVVYLHGTTAMVNMGQYKGFSCDINNLTELLRIAVNAAEQSPTCIHLHHYTEHDYAAIGEVGKNIIIKEDFYNPSQFYCDMAKQAMHVNDFNLLHGMYKTKKAKFPEMRKMRNTIMYLSLTWVFLLFLYPVASYFMLKQKVNVIDGQIAAVYKRNFPLSMSIVAPKKRMEEKLQKLNTETSESKLLTLIRYLGKSMIETPSISLKRLDFQNNQLTLELTAAMSDDFSKFTEFLTRQGLHVKQQSANLVGTRVNAVITVE